MLLNDRLLKVHGPKTISPYREELVQPASIDLLLGPEFVVFIELPNFYNVVDPEVEHIKHKRIRVKKGLEFCLEPNEFVLASTHETVTLPNMLAGRVEGKSSLGRLGLLTHITAGFIDPGFHGQITLELKNVSNSTIVLYPGMRIAQLCLFKMIEPPEKPYGNAGNHYQGQEGPQPCRIHERFKVYDVYEENRSENNG